MSHARAERPAEPSVFAPGARVHWDAVVVDECQHVAVRGREGPAQRSQRAKLASLLARTSDALILTSATPQDGKKESFASLMNLLEPTAIADEQDYSAEDVAGLFVRRFKKDIQSQVQGSFRERAIHPDHVDAGPEENAVFELLQGATFRTIHPRRRRGPGEEQVYENSIASVVAKILLRGSIEAGPVPRKPTKAS